MVIPEVTIQIYGLMPNRVILALYSILAQCVSSIPTASTCLIFRKPRVATQDSCFRLLVIVSKEQFTLRPIEYFSIYVIPVASGFVTPVLVVSLKLSNVKRVYYLDG
uniref:Uncharacterized protein n=1 Tax=Cacopsylla melanoneura TaxID=428564 RepID=A0A8D8RH10_9HEMI